MKPSWLVAVLGVVSACGSSGGGGTSKATVQASESCAYPPCDAASGTAACRYPPTVALGEGGSAPGCFAGPAGQNCEVSNGATVLQDGGVINGTESCTSLCQPGEFELSCRSEAITGPIPSPDASLGCQPIRGPTPSNALSYCCPCAP